MLKITGLICMFMSLHAGEYIAKMSEEAVYEESPYSQYQRMATLPPPGTSSSASSHHLGGNGHWQSPTSSQGISAAEKSHVFKPHTFRVARYCDLCRNFMWGLVQQGLRCEDCGFAAHKRCSERTRPDCQPELHYVKRIFSVDLTTLCMAHKVSVPCVVEHCVGELKRRGLTTEGLYRVSGSHEDVAKLRAAYDREGSKQPANLLAKLSRVEDVHTISSLHKLYLRNLPLPLITLPAYRALSESLARSQFISFIV